MSSNVAIGSGVGAPVAAPEIGRAVSVSNVAPDCQIASKMPGSLPLPPEVVRTAKGSPAISIVDHPICAAVIDPLPLRRIDSGELGAAVDFDSTISKDNPPRS